MEIRKEMMYRVLNEHRFVILETYDLEVAKNEINILRERGLKCEIQKCEVYEVLDSSPIYIPTKEGFES